MGRIAGTIGLVFGDAVVSGVTLTTKFDPAVAIVFGAISICGIVLAAYQIADIVFQGDTERSP
ncbi:hypothetical protein [Stratiformator vulcanicus]|uniref:Uncharacterized protein n=1 Tax=Stratiformator vulcanicus TaxID=2527980 RepID=A0A517R0R9_9PLAN|nr:hypothetical protein [Stratiformator vulcanicus]QDT37433.1 hypothetical protein Pan189_18130 [Stratiformator vulcanicus]